MRTSLSFALALLGACSVVTDPGSFEEAPPVGVDSGSGRVDSGEEDAGTVEDAGEEDAGSTVEDAGAEDTAPPAVDAGIQCPDGQLAIPSGCGGTPVCRPPPDRCEGPPRCGCDGRIYQDTCELFEAGIAMQDIGACMPGPMCCDSATDCADGDVCVRPDAASTGICLLAPPPRMCFTDMGCADTQQCRGATTCTCGQMGCVPRPGMCF